jgi:hypothetical protein
MQALIEAIRVAVATEASTEQKASGAQACRTILAALDTEPGKPFVLPGMPMPAATSRVSVDQMLDLMIARMTTIASERDAQPAPTAAPPMLATSSPRGLRVPVAPAALPRRTTRPVVPAKRPNHVARKP